MFAQYQLNDNDTNHGNKMDECLTKISTRQHMLGWNSGGRVRNQMTREQWQGTNSDRAEHESGPPLKTSQTPSEGSTGAGQLPAGVVPSPATLQPDRRIVIHVLRAGLPMAERDTPPPP